MANFTTEGLLAASVTANGCCVLFFASNRVLSYCLRNSERKADGIVDKLLELNGDDSRILNRMIAEQLVTLITVILGVALLVSSAVFKTPFTNVDNFTVFEIAFCINIGKHSYKIVQDSLLFRYVSLYAVKLIHHLVTVACYSVFVAYHQNALLGVIGLIMEISNLTEDVVRVMKKMGVEKHEQTYLNTVIVHCISTVTFRGLLPCAFVTTAIVLQNPFQMHYMPLSFFFLSMVFYFAINLWVIKLSIDGIRSSLKACKEWRLRDALNLTEPEVCTHSTVTTGSATTNFDKFYKNNFCYLKPYSNVNLTTDVRSTDCQLSEPTKVSKVQWCDLVAANEQNQGSKLNSAGRKYSSISSSSDDSTIHDVPVIRHTVLLTNDTVADDRQLTADVHVSSITEDNIRMDIQTWDKSVV